MKGIIIAAGPAKRLRPITENLPKCMLKINGKPIIQNTIELFRNNGINDISIIRGWQKNKISLKDVNYFENSDFWNNNILHSLMSAREKLEESIRTAEDVVMSYSDILYNDIVIKTLLKRKAPIVAIVDTDWESYYHGRTDHPISEAEKVIMDSNNKIVKIGKGLLMKDVQKNMQGEFIGLWKFTPAGTETFLKRFDLLNGKLSKTQSFQDAKEWQKSYITDIFQEMTEQGEVIHCAVIYGNWKEFDTVQDFLRAGGELPEGVKLEIMGE